jgi:hypothetical protein
MMKRFYLLPLFFLIFISAYGQEAIVKSDIQQKFKFGPMLGLGFSSLDERKSNFHHIRLQTGIIISYQIANKLFFQPTVMLTGKGYESDLFLFPGNDRVNLTYCDVSMIFKYNPWNILLVGLGIEGGRLLKANYKYLAYGTDYYDSGNISSAVNKFDYGINGTLGCRFQNGINMEISLMFGLADVFNDNRSDTFHGDSYGYSFHISENAKGQNTVISGTLYYLFKTKKRNFIN